MRGGDFIKYVVEVRSCKYAAVEKVRGVDFIEYAVEVRSASMQL